MHLPASDAHPSRRRLLSFLIIGFTDPAAAPPGPTNSENVMRSPIRTTRLSVETLDDRIVPAAARVDLTHHGAQAVVGGAIVRQADAQPVQNFDMFVRIDGGSVEQGYNTDARPLQFDEQANPDVTHSLTLGSVPKVTVGGATFREFVLDIRERAPQLSLDEVRIFLGSTGNLKGYNAQTHTLAGQTAVFNLDSGRDVSVIMNEKTSRGQGFGDLTLLVPESAFAGANSSTFVYLYSKLGGAGGARADGGAETWAVRDIAEPPPSPPPPPPPSASPSSLSGHVLINDGSSTLQPFQGVSITLLDANGNVVATATTDTNGAYSFTNLAAGTYTIVEGTVPFAFSYQDGPDNVGTAGGTSNANDQFTVTLGSGVDGANYDFTEILVG
jgi:hypothetical protein